MANNEEAKNANEATGAKDYMESESRESREQRESRESRESRGNSGGYAGTDACERIESFEDYENLEGLEGIGGLNGLNGHGGLNGLNRHGGLNPLNSLNSPDGIESIDGIENPEEYEEPEGLGGAESLESIEVPQGCEERLKAFFEKLGIDVDLPEVQALIAACVFALNKADAADDSALANFFPESATFALPLFFDLMGINYFPGATAADVVAYLAETPTPLTFTSFDAAATSFCPTASYTTEGFDVILSWAEPFSASVLSGISRFIKNYLPAFCTPKGSGDGITFEEFDALGLAWRILDAAALPFSIIDELNSLN